MNANKPLQGQRAIVTGGSSGIGEAVARTLAAAGAKTVINYLMHDGTAERIVAEIKAEGGEAMAIQADISDETQVQNLFASAVDAWGSVDILVNNAGIQVDAGFLDMTLAQWQKVIDVNLTGHFLCAREAAREFLRRGIRKELSCSAGKIIFISSVHEIIPWAGHVNYAASKGGIGMLMRSIAQELAEHGVRVNSIAPGAIRTPINRGAWETREAEADLLKLIPYGRVGHPEDIGKAALWLASDASDYVTGETLYVDGGMTLYPGFREGG